MFTSEDRNQRRRCDFEPSQTASTSLKQVRLSVLGETVQKAVNDVAISMGNVVSIYINTLSIGLIGCIVVWERWQNHLFM